MNQAIRNCMETTEGKIHTKLEIKLLVTLRTKTAQAKPGKTQSLLDVLKCQKLSSLVRKQIIILHLSHGTAIAKLYGKTTAT